MKKILLCILIIICLFAIFSCGKKDSETNIPDPMGFSELEILAVDPPTDEQKNYTITGELLKIEDINLSNTVVQCLGSNLISYKNEDKGTYTLKNIFTNRTIKSGITQNGIMISYYGGFNSYGNVYASNEFPVAIFAEYDALQRKNEVTYIDCYGKKLRTETIDTIRYLGETTKKVIDDYTYVCVNMSNEPNEPFCFRFSFKDDKYVVETIDFEEYEDIELATSVENNSVTEYKDGLEPIYDGENEIIAYYYGNLYGKIVLYDEDKEYVTTFNPSSYGFGSGYKTLRLEDKICLFQSEEYYEKAMEVGSKKTYKCKLLEFDLTNGNVEYDNDFKYFVDNCYTKVNDGKFCYAYILFRNLNEKGELSDISKCVILKDELSFDESFVYDRLPQTVYRIDKNSLLIYLDSQWYYVTKDNRVMLNGISILSFYKDGTVLYRNQDQKYYTCKLDSIKESIKSLDGGLTYISSHLYNGKLISYNYDETSEEYLMGDLILKKGYINLATSGIYVTDNSIHIGDDLIFSCDEDIEIKKVDWFTTIDNKRIYKITLSTDEIRYFWFSSVEEK